MGAIIAGALILFLGIIFNLQHFIDQKVGGMAQGVKIATDYAIFNAFLAQDNAFGRAVYIPGKPRFAYFSLVHPAVFMTDWIILLKPLLKFELFDRSAPPNVQFDGVPEGSVTEPSRAPVLSKTRMPIVAAT